MPDGGRGGFYTNWFNNGEGGHAALGGLAHQAPDPLRRQPLPHPRDPQRERAIAGLSMGGFGTFTYAARHPDLFTAALSLSGAVDTHRWRPGVIDAISGSDGGPPGSLWGPFETAGGALARPQPAATSPRTCAAWRSGCAPATVSPAGRSAAARPSTSSRPAWRHGQERPPAPATSSRIPHVFDDYGAGPAPLAVLEPRARRDAARDHGALPPRLAAAGARDLHGGRAELLGVRVERERQAPGDGVQPARQRRPARASRCRAAAAQRSRPPRALSRRPRLQGRDACAAEARAACARTANAAVACASPCALGPGNPVQQFTRRRAARGCSRRA